ncbi:FecR family protein [Ancylomarina salipaludis]|uniref:FecR family protein n=1 Tax=Ancylomarina salipaludis TaxID=2501299 RepID=A0A4Q1JKG4_9BACT|nr:FecR family protein [Ancylomarina salipaludis]RXQ90982.1 FecR family protein [Ancylomarina salipaludis]
MKSIKTYIERARIWAKLILSDDLSNSELNDSELDDIHDVASGKYEVWRNTQVKRFNEKAVWANIENKIGKGEQQLPKIIRLLKPWRSVAAAILLMVLGAELYFIFQDLQTVKTVEVLPGESLAYLQVDNQNKIDLSVQDTLLLFYQVNAQVDSGQLVYAKIEGDLSKIETHTINVPSKGEYFVQLSDGTKVWMNSESSLRFKSKFTGKQRVVDLVGEAYFEVAKNPDQPFIVRTANTFVKVLGTKFNVKAYADEAYTYTTLNEGKVKLIMDDKQQIMAPNEQVVFDKKNRQYTKKVVDASIYSAWTKGQFVFKDERLEDILSSLSRWYGVKVFYKHAQQKEERFSISVNRYDEIQPLLNHIELTGNIHLKINKSALIVE